MRVNDVNKPEPPTTNPEPSNRIECSALFEGFVPVFESDEDYQRFRDEFRDRMEPILKEQRKARAQSWLDICDRVYFSNVEVMREDNE